MPLQSGVAAAVPAPQLLPVLSLAGAPARAWAHDPGQGEPVRTGRLSVDRTAEPARLSLELDGDCAGLRPVRAVARRAGDVVTARLDEGRACVFSGELPGLEDGRWFVYAELTGPGQGDIEAWLPVRSGQAVAEVRTLYAPPGSPERTSQAALGGVLLLIVAWLVLGCLRLSRRVGRSSRIGP